MTSQISIDYLISKLMTKAAIAIAVSRAIELHIGVSAKYAQIAVDHYIAIGDKESALNLYTSLPDAVKSQVTGNDNAYFYGFGDEKNERAMSSIYRGIAANLLHNANEAEKVGKPRAPTMWRNHAIDYYLEAGDEDVAYRVAKEYGLKKAIKRIEANRVKKLEERGKFTAAGILAEEQGNPKMGKVYKTLSELLKI